MRRTQRPAEYGRAPAEGTLLWDGRRRGITGSDGWCLAADGDRLIAHFDWGYDDYRGAEWALEDPALASEARALQREAL